MAFFRWGGPSVRLGFIRFTPDKAPEKSIEPAVTPVVAAGSFVFVRFAADGCFLRLPCAGIGAALKAPGDSVGTVVIEAQRRVP